MKIRNNKIEEIIGKFEKESIHVHTKFLGQEHMNEWLRQVLQETENRVRKEERERIEEWNEKRKNYYMKKFAIKKNDYMDGWEDGWNKAVKDTIHYLQALKDINN